MNTPKLIRRDEGEWMIKPQGKMRVPAIFYASADLMAAMDAKVYAQLCNVAALPGIVQAAYAMPDAHWGYGFPIGGVAAFDPEAGGVVSAGGVGFDISCGVRTMLTGLKRCDIEKVKHPLADALFKHIPAGVGSTGSLKLSAREMDAMLTGGARWAVSCGYGADADLRRIEENGCMAGADPDAVSSKAQQRQQEEMGTLGSGNHYLEIQHVAELYDAAIGAAFGLREGEVVVSIHCGSRGLGHQIGTEFLKEMVLGAVKANLDLPERELAYAPIRSSLGQRYLAAMRAAINCALANRQIITHLTRETFSRFLPGAHLPLLYDVSHNTCKEETHRVDGKKRNLFVHRKGATRSFGPGHPALPPEFQAVGQPVLVGGSMGTSSYILAGVHASQAPAFASACHGAGRAMSRNEAMKKGTGKAVIAALAQQGILIRSPSLRGVAEEAPYAYKDIAAVVRASQQAGLAKAVARLEPMICIKG